MSDLWLHPAVILLLGAALLPLVPSRLKLLYLILVPLLLFARTLGLSKGVFGEVSFLQWTLTFGRVDSLSLVFGYIMAIACLIGTLYGAHVKRDSEHMAAWTYAAGSLGAIYAGDLLTLFLFWEVMAFSSVFLRGAGRDPRGRHDSPRHVG
jgi:multicomponent Na+:H+ antiporter subunit D